VDNKMEVDYEDESKIYSFDDGREMSWRRGSYGSLKEGVHEGGINKSNEGGNVKGNTFWKKDRWEWWGSKCEFVVNIGVFIVIGHVIACDPKEAILDDQLGKDHVGLNVLYLLK
jgi:hypothetical protein